MKSKDPSVICVLLKSAHGPVAIKLLQPHCRLVALLSILTLFTHYSWAAGDVWSGGVSGVWDGGSLNWVVNGVPNSAYTSGDAVTFDDTGSAANMISSGSAVTPASVSVNSSLNSYTISAPIGGTASLTKSGSSILTLTGANTYTGPTVIKGGTLSLTGSGTLSGAGALAISNGATLISYVNNGLSGGSGTHAAGAWTIDGTLTGAGGAQTTSTSITLNNGTMSGPANSYWGTFLTSGFTTITANGANNVINAGTFGLNGSIDFETPLASDVLSLSCVLGGVNTHSGDLYFNAAGAGTVTLTGQSIYTGTTYILGGVVQIGDGTTDGSIAASASIDDEASLVFNLVGIQTNSMVISGGGTLTKSGSGILVLTSSGNTYSGNTIINGGTLQLGTGLAGQDGAIASGNIVNNGALVYDLVGNNSPGYVISGSGSLTKEGTGALTLSGVNTYSGATTINGGTLLVNSPGSLAAGSAVSVASGAALGGNGTVNGAANVAAGGSLIPGSGGAVGTLTLGNGLTLNGGELSFALKDASAAGSSYSQVAVSGQLVLNGANTIALTFPNGTAPAGTYTLMTYAGKTGSGTLALATSYPNATLTIGATSVTLTVTGGGIGNVDVGDVWSGGVSGVWDGGSLNWVVNGGAEFGLHERRCGDV